MPTPLRRQIHYYLDRIIMYRDIPTERDITAWLTELDKLATDADTAHDDQIMRLENQVEDIRDMTSFTPAVAEALAQTQAMNPDHESHTESML